jgi:hypothetical protein
MIIGITQKIFEFFLQSGATKFIFFSSVKAVVSINSHFGNKFRDL